MEGVREALLGADVVVPHTDADGLAAGALALRARGESTSAARLYGRGENPWVTPPEGTPALLDWGMRALAGPAIIVDHHAPEAEPAAGGGHGHADRRDDLLEPHRAVRRRAVRP